VSQPLRDALRLAITAQREAVTAEGVAIAAAERGLAAARDAAAILAGMEHIDGEIAAFRADLARRGETFVELPDTLVTARLRRRDAADALTDTMNAATALKVELEVATADRLAAFNVMLRAANTVLMADADVLAGELVGLEAEAAELRLLLAYVPAGRNGANVPDRLFRALHAPPGGVPVATPPQMSERWSQYTNALMADADAKLADIELPPPIPAVLPFVAPPQRMTIAGH